MLKNSLFFLFLILNSLNLKAGETPKFINAFIKSISDSHIKPDLIISKYLCMEEKDRNSEYYKLVISQLESVRKEFKNSPLEALKTLKYNDLPNVEKVIIMETTERENTYVIKRGTKTILSLLVKDNKINSFVTMNKGENKIFFKLCK